LDIYLPDQDIILIFLNKSKNINTCKNCEANVFCERIPHAHLFIDVEHAYHSAILNQIGFSDSPKNVVLSEISTCLQIKDEKYRLIGVISHNGAEQEIGHYIAYCRRIIGVWEEYDSLKNKCVKLQASIKFVKPSVLAYVKLINYL